MKWMIASDVHGSALWCERMLAAAEAAGARRVLLLGDLLYHGPRNDLPEGYDPRAVAALLNRWADRILCVRGNCDAEVDQMVLDFPIRSDYAALDLGGRLLYATHGHLCGPDDLPPLRPGDVFLFGHTHVPFDETRGGVRCLNPGSVALPKGGSDRGVLFLENGVFTRQSL